MIYGVGPHQSPPVIQNNYAGLAGLMNKFNPLLAYGLPGTPITPPPSDGAKWASVNQPPKNKTRAGGAGRAKQAKNKQNPSVPIPADSSRASPAGSPAQPQGPNNPATPYQPTSGSTQVVTGTTVTLLPVSVPPTPSATTGAPYQPSVTPTPAVSQPASNPQERQKVAPVTIPTTPATSASWISTTTSPTPTSPPSILEPVPDSRVEPTSPPFEPEIKSSVSQSPSEALAPEPIISTEGVTYPSRIFYSMTTLNNNYPPKPAAVPYAQDPIAIESHPPATEIVPQQESETRLQKNNVAEQAEQSTSPSDEPNVPTDLPPLAPGFPKDPSTEQRFPPDQRARPFPPPQPEWNFHNHIASAPNQPPVAQNPSSSPEPNTRLSPGQGNEQHNPWVISSSSSSSNANSQLPQPASQYSSRPPVAEEAPPTTTRTSSYSTTMDPFIEEFLRPATPIPAPPLADFPAPAKTYFKQTSTAPSSLEPQSEQPTSAAPLDQSSKKPTAPPAKAAMKPYFRQNSKPRPFNKPAVAATAEPGAEVTTPKTYATKSTRPPINNRPKPNPYYKTTPASLASTSPKPSSSYQPSSTDGLELTTIEAPKLSPEAAESATAPAYNPQPPNTFFAAQVNTAAVEQPQPPYLFFQPTSSSTAAPTTVEAQAEPEKTSASYVRTTTAAPSRRTEAPTSPSTRRAYQRPSSTTAEPHSESPEIAPLPTPAKTYFKPASLTAEQRPWSSSTPNPITSSTAQVFYSAAPQSAASDSWTASSARPIINEIPPSVNTRYPSGSAVSSHDYPPFSAQQAFVHLDNDGDFSAIPGEPGVDYPIFNDLPQTDFKCSDQTLPGYYADVSARCQMFHVCWDFRQWSFLCPNGTVFSQQHFVCVWWDQFECNQAPGLYDQNARLFIVPPSQGNYKYGSSETIQSRTLDVSAGDSNNNTEEIVLPSAIFPLISTATVDEAVKDSSNTSSSLDYYKTESHAAGKEVGNSHPPAELKTETTSARPIAHLNSTKKSFTSSPGVKPDLLKRIKVHSPKNPQPSNKAHYKLSKKGMNEELKETTTPISHQVEYEIEKKSVSTTSSAAPNVEDISTSTTPGVIAVSTEQPETLVVIAVSGSSSSESDSTTLYPLTT